MIIYPNTVKRQGNITTGVVTLIIALVIATIGAVVAIFLYRHDNSFFYLPIIFASFMYKRNQ